MRLHNLVASLLVAAAAITPTAASAATGPLPGCTPTQPDGSRVRLGNADNGRTVCLLPRQRLSVVLSVDPASYPDQRNWWTAITADGDALAPVPNPVLPVRGTTLATFVAVRPGTATVTSTRNICPPGYLCGAPLLLWRVTAEVTGGRG
jgi:hypothetical protein